MQLNSVNISIVLDKSGLVPVIRVYDTTAYGGLVAGITGIVTIQQPDGMVIVGNFSNPDVFYFGGALQPATKELRLALDSNFQKGNYIVAYTARSAGYDDTTVTESFSLDYDRPGIVLTPTVDVFTPSLKVNDTSNYVLANFALQSTVRSWQMASTPGNTSAANVTQFDLAIGGHYYDSEYAVSMDVVMSYLINGHSNISVIDKATAPVAFSTVVPISLNTLFGLINTYKAGTGNSCKCDEDFDARQKNYMLAYTLFMNFIHRGTCGDRTGLLTIYNELRAVINNNASVPYTISDAIISTYYFNTFCGIAGGAVPLVITQQPISQTVSAGANLSFSGTASGQGPLTWQWRKNGANIVGATTPVLNISGASSGDQAVYDFVVTDALSNSLISSPANLIVTAAQVLVTNFWGWTSVDPSTVSLATLSPQMNNANQVSGLAALVDFRSAPNLQFLFFIEPDTEPIKTTYSNSNLINGMMGDGFTWKPFALNGGFRYYYTAQLVTFDPQFKTTLAP